MNLSRSLLTAGVIVIKAGGSALAKLTNAAVAFLNGGIVSVAAADLPALTSFNIPKAAFGVVLFVADAAGTVTKLYVSDASSFSTVSGARGSTAALAVWPKVPADKICLGGILIGAKSDTAFTGGSTALDASGYTFVFFDGLGQLQPVGNI
jgi:hypothetical protein